MVSIINVHNVNTTNVLNVSATFFLKSHIHLKSDHRNSIYPVLRSSALMKKIISKFGGTSMGSSAAMLRSGALAIEQNSNLVVVSAVSKITDLLLEGIACSEKGEGFETVYQTLFEKHKKIANELSLTVELTQKIDALLGELKTLFQGISLLKECSPKAKDRVVSFGELLSSILFARALQTLNTDKKITWIDARDIIITDSNYGKATPNLKLISKQANELIQLEADRIYVTQGFIGRDEHGASTVLGRGGSDTTASLFAEALDADILEIWTDVPGMASTDPRICKDARMIAEITYNEAAEMAQYGAKVLHPATLAPCIRKNIPIFVGSSFEKEKAGTWIRAESSEKPLIRAIAKRSKQALLTLKSTDMLQAYGFLFRIFEVYSKYKISVDCVTTSEISVAVTVDEEVLNQKEFIAELKKLGELKIESGLALVSIIGNGILEQAGVAKTVFSSIDHINVRMMCLGASATNFNILVREEHSNDCIQSLHKHVF